MVKSTLVATVYVNPVKGNDANAGSRLAPFKSLTHALNVTTTPTIIQLAPGTYDVASGELFPLIVPRGVTVLGDEANKGQGIVILGGGEYQSQSFGVQNITLILLGDASLKGVTVTNSMTKGTGVWIESTAPTIANNTFINCGREGVFTSGTAKPAILDNVFIHNATGGLLMAGSSKGKVLRNVFQKNVLGIAISDFASPLLANNQLFANRIAIALSREARPVLRQNVTEKNTQSGLLINGNALPDLGNTQDIGGNIFRDNREFDLQNLTPHKLVSVGNLLNPVLVKGLVIFIVATKDTCKIVSNNTFFSNPNINEEVRQAPAERINHSPTPSLFPPTAPTAPPAPPAPPALFLAGHWAAAFVEPLVSKGLISSFTDGKFQPDAPMNRAEYATIIAQIFQLTPSRSLNKFTDIESDFWAASAIFSAVSQGFLHGFPDGTFQPEQNLTRTQAIASMVNGLKLTGGNPNVLAVYSDRAEIPSDATNAVAIATQNLLVVNYPQTDQLEPLRDITRAEVAALIYQALVISGTEKAIASPYIVSPNLDIPSIKDISGHWAEAFIQALVSIGVTSVFADDTYQPDQPVNRAQYAALIVKAFNPTAKLPASHFIDVPKDLWAYSAIQQAAKGGFVSGFKDKTFRPDQNVQRLQVIVSLVNGLALQKARSDEINSYSDYNAIPHSVRRAVATATQHKIIVNYPNPRLLQPYREVTRGEVAAMVYQALVAIKRTSAINSGFIVSPFAVDK